MPLTDLEVLTQLQTSRDNLLYLIIELTSQPKPNYDIDGQKIDWADYLKLLQSSLDSIEKQIAVYNPPIDGEEIGYC